MSNSQEFRTYLYIKQHAVTGKLYFGKTRKNPEKYQGSGTYWQNHIKKHGKSAVVTLWYELFFDEEECKAFALEFSKKMDIVNSSSWLNLVDENGIDGHPKGYRPSIEARKRMSASRVGKSPPNLGKSHTEETKERMRNASPWKGRSQPLEAIAKRSATRKGEIPKQVTCPYCGKTGAIMNMSRWHFSKCKLLTKD